MKQITEKEFEALENKVWLTFLSNATPLEIYKSVATSNWDSNGFLLNWIKDNPDTDKATVLLAYWYSTPRYLKQYKDRTDCEKNANWLLENFDFVEDIEKKYTNGFYTNETIYFNPKNGIDSHDWTAEYSDISIVREIPKTMFLETKGKIKLNQFPEDFEEGLPIQPVNYAQQVYDLYDKYEYD